MYTLKRLVCTVSLRLPVFSLIVLMMGALLIGGCAYFNTFYNAKNYFRSAEEEMAKKATGEKLSKQAEEALDKTIANCNIVLQDFPESKLRDDALFLSAKALYYRDDIATSRKRLQQLQRDHSESPFLEEATLWLCRCKWKLGDIESAQRDLKVLSESLEQDGGSREQRVQVAITLGEIHIELGNKSAAVEEFRKAVKLSKDSVLKGQLLLNSGEILMQINQTENALKLYREVLKVTSDPNQLNMANLEVVRILRILERWDETIKTIRVLLTNEKFTSLKSDLNLELAQLYEMRGMTQEAISRYTSITEDFPKTEASAAAYFQLGGLALSESEDYEAAKRYFSNVEKEKRSSLLVPSARVYVNEIEAYLDVENSLDVLEAVLAAARLESEETQESDPADSVESVPDSLIDPVQVEETAVTDTLTTRQEIAQNLYSLGELYAFHFNREDSAIKVLEELVSNYPESDSRPQALYTLGYLLNERGDSALADNYVSQLIETYPTTEYAIKAAAELGIELINKAEELLESAETHLRVDPESAILLYKRILNEYPESQYVPHAIFSIGYTYENSLHDIDSTLSYYGRLVETFPESDQTESIRYHYRQLSTAFNQALSDSLSEQAKSDTTLIQIEGDSIAVEFERDTTTNEIDVDSAAMELEMDATIFEMDSTTVESETDSTSSQNHTTEPIEKKPDEAD